MKNGTMVFHGKLKGLLSFTLKKPTTSHSDSLDGYVTYENCVLYAQIV